MTNLGDSSKFEMPESDFQKLAYQAQQHHARSKSNWIKECISRHLSPKDIWINSLNSDDPHELLVKASKRVARLGFRIREYPDKSVMMKGDKVIGVFTFKI